MRQQTGSLRRLWHTIVLLREAYAAGILCIAKEQNLLLKPNHGTIHSIGGSLSGSDCSVLLRGQ